MTLHFSGTYHPPAETYDEPYLATPELTEAVNDAIILGRPLLVRGEPGSGKTRLARAVAGDLQLDYFAWQITSASKARDGLYTFDALARLRDAQMRYVRLGPLGEAIKRADARRTTPPKTSVVLIDEIDKADIDFPNDLLRELEDLAFTVDELEQGDPERHYRTALNVRPIVIITSNEEKPLPDAFLRRCIDFYIPFPAPDELERILDAHMQQLTNQPLSPAEADIIGDFLRVRRVIEGSALAARSPGTSELIDALKLLRRRGKSDHNSQRRILASGVVLKAIDAALVAAVRQELNQRAS